MKRSLNTTINRCEERNTDTFGYNDRSEVTTYHRTGQAANHQYSAASIDEEWNILRIGR